MHPTPNAQAVCENIFKASVRCRARRLRGDDALVRRSHKLERWAASSGRALELKVRRRAWSASRRRVFHIYKSARYSPAAIAFSRASGTASAIAA